MIRKKEHWSSSSIYVHFSSGDQRKEYSASNLKTYPLVKIYHDVLNHSAYAAWKSIPKTYPVRAVVERNDVVFWRN